VLPPGEFTQTLQGGLARDTRGDHPSSPMNDDPRLEINAGDASIAIDPATATVVVRIGRLQRILSLDEALLVSVRRFHNPWRTAVARALTRFGDGGSWAAMGFACLATLTPYGRHLGLRVGAGSILGSLFAQALKRSLTRPRPDVSIAGFEALAVNPDRFSFPSGHTAAAFGVAVALADEPHGIGPTTLLLATGIGLSRVYLGAHYPLDVLAGAFLGVCAGLASRLLVA
jgi:undecaprenyl-diphosphatase